MSYTMAEFAKAHKQLHEGGGRRQDHVRATSEQIVTVVEIVSSVGESGNVRDGVYCRYKREGSTVVCAPVRWNDPINPPTVGQRVMLKSWGGSIHGDNSLLSKL